MAVPQKLSDCMRGKLRQAVSDKELWRDLTELLDCLVDASGASVTDGVLNSASYDAATQTITLVRTSGLPNLTLALTGVGRADAEDDFSGATNGAQTAFVLSAAPLSGRLVEVFWNGHRLRAGDDYTLAGSTVTMAIAPLAGHNLIITYGV